MAFRFKLQKVLDHREILVDLAEKEYLEAKAILNKEETKLHEMRQELHRARQSILKIVSSGQSDSAERMKQIHGFEVLQDRRIETQIKVVSECQKGVEAKQEILRQKLTERKILEKLKEKHLQDYIEERKSKEQSEADEMSILRFRHEDQYE